MIELLVVVAIIAILAALLFPVFARAKAASKSAGCLSNLRQIGAGIGLYMADADDLFPHAVDPIDKVHPEIWDGFPEFRQRIPDMPYLHEAIQPYVKSKELFRCPSDSGTAVNDDRPWLEFGTAPTMHATYGTSYFFRTEIAFRTFSQTNFQLPSDVNVLFDAAGHWHGSGGKMTANVRPRDLPERLRQFRYNTLFGDFHVKSLSYGQIQTAWDTSLD